MVPVPLGDVVLLMAGRFLSFICDIGMVLGPVAGYFFQYLEIIKTRKSDGFSTGISCILIIANVLRVFFWVGKRFSEVILLAAILMIIAQFFLIEVCFRFRKKPISVHSGRGLFGIQQILEDPCIKYTMFLFGFTLGVAFVSYFFIGSMYYVELIGFLSAAVEACLGIPQFINNYRNKSTEGFTPILLLCWTGGDMFKSLYYFLKDCPLQLLGCSLFQLTLDFCIILQFYVYRKGTLERKMQIFQSKEVEDNLIDKEFKEIKAKKSSKNGKSKRTLDISKITEDYDIEIDEIESGIH